jgi:hypothetical protein
MQAVDKSTLNVFESLLKPDDPSTAQLAAAEPELMDEALRQAAGVDSFQCVLSDGVTSVELCRGGAARKLTTSNRHEWVALATARRLHESDAQAAALREGVSSVVPIDLFNLFTPEELDALICGKPDFSVDLLKVRRREIAPHWFVDSMLLCGRLCAECDAVPRQSARRFAADSVVLVDIGGVHARPKGAILAVRLGSHSPAAHTRAVHHQIQDSGSESVDDLQPRLALPTRVHMYDGLLLSTLCAASASAACAHTSRVALCGRRLLLNAATAVQLCQSAQAKAPVCHGKHWHDGCRRQPQELRALQLRRRWCSSLSCLSFLRSAERVASLCR